MNQRGGAAGMSQRAGVCWCGRRRQSTAVQRALSPQRLSLQLAAVVVVLLLLSEALLLGVICQNTPGRSLTQGETLIPSCDENDPEAIWENQTSALLALYRQLGGPYWTKNFGWRHAAAQSSANESGVGVASSSCYLLDELCDSGGCREQLLKVSGTVPDYCCWHGVRCCLPELCNTSLQLYMDCGCVKGTVTGLQLSANNVSGVLADVTNETWTQLSCSLAVIFMSFNNLTGRFPTNLNSLSVLSQLSLSANRLSGTLPVLEGLENLLSLDVSNNLLCGEIENTICVESTEFIGETSYPSRLTDLLISDNWFTGRMMPVRCRNLISILAAGNDFVMVGPISQNVHIMTYDGSRIDGTLSEILTSYQLKTISMTSNSIGGTIPAWITNIIGLNEINLNDNNLRGTLPQEMFRYLASLAIVELSNNSLTGTIPESIGSVNTLQYLQLQNNQLTGSIPNTLTQIVDGPLSTWVEEWEKENIHTCVPQDRSRTAPLMRAAASSLITVVNVIGNALSCCGVNNTNKTLGGSYQFYNLSSSRLPSGFTFSDDDFTIFSNNIRCPTVVFQPLPQQTVRLGTSFIVLELDPSYYMYEGCSCVQENADLVNLSAGGFWNFTCITRSSPDGWLDDNLWIFAIIIVLAFIIICAALWYLLVRQRLYQQWLAIHKRLKGAPLDRIASIVVTDIEGFSDLMSSSPEKMSEALRMHNELVRKAQWDNVGFTLEQEGDSFAISFYEPADAINFCLQLQQLLERHEWPDGLFSPWGLPRRPRTGNYHRWLTALLNQASDASHKLSSSFWLGSTRGSSASAASRTNHPLPSVLEGGDSGGGAFLGTGVRDSGGDGAHVVLESVPLNHTPLPTLSMRPRLPAGKGEVKHARPRPFEDPPLEMTEGLDGRCEISGMRVRMGVATGMLTASGINSPVMDLAKVISDAGAGGQVLLCQNTFIAVADRRKELGSMTTYRQAGWRPAGMCGCFGKSDSSQAANEVVLLDMGSYLAVGSGPWPLIVPPIQLEPDTSHGFSLLKPRLQDGLQASPSGAPRGGAPHSRSFVPTASDSSRLGVFQSLTLPHVRNGAFRRGQQSTPEQLDGARMRVFQALAPCHAHRARQFGRDIDLPTSWMQVDAPYFHAPGAACSKIFADPGSGGSGGSVHSPDPRPRHAAGQPPDARPKSAVANGGNSTHGAGPGARAAPSISSALPSVTVVFCGVDGGLGFARGHPRDAAQVHYRVIGVMQSALRQVPGGYFVKSQGDLKYVLVFRHAWAALMWGACVQECCMYEAWPASALERWPEEHDPHTGQLLFRGPRLKMGIAKGPPRMIVPAHTGRADYLGPCVNLAARIMGAAAHAGQVAIDESVVSGVVAAWDSVKDSVAATSQHVSRVPSGTPASASERSRRSGQLLSRCARRAPPMPPSPRNLDTLPLPALLAGRTPSGSTASGRSLAAHNADDADDAATSCGGGGDAACARLNTGADSCMGRLPAKCDMGGGPVRPGHGPVSLRIRSGHIWRSGRDMARAGNALMRVARRCSARAAQQQAKTEQLRQPPVLQKGSSGAALAPQSRCRVQVLRVGNFRFKGFHDTLPIVEVRVEPLLGRRCGFDKCGRCGGGVAAPSWRQLHQSVSNELSRSELLLKGWGHVWC